MRGKDRKGKGKGKATDIYDTLEINLNNLFCVE